MDQRCISEKSRVNHGGGFASLQAMQGIVCPQRRLNVGWSVALKSNHLRGLDDGWANRDVGHVALLRVLSITVTSH